MLSGLGEGGMKISEDKCPALFILLKVSQRHFRHLVFAVKGTHQVMGQLSIIWNSCIQHCVTREEGGRSVKELPGELPLPAELEEGTLWIKCHSQN